MRRGKNGRTSRAVHKRPQPFIFHYEPEDETFRFRLQFKKSHVTREELVTDVAGDIGTVGRGVGGG